MEFFIGSVVTIVTYIVAHRVAKRDVDGSKSPIKISYSQSHVYDLIRPFLNFVPPPEIGLPRQSNKYLQNSYIKIMVMNNKAYWIKNNIFYVADVLNGEVQKETQKEVDTMSMSKVELNEMMFIVEKLREEDNDYRGPGQSDI